MIGQVGIVGPVALATARLHALLGDDAAARRDLSLAEGIARRGGGLPSLLRARLLACELDGQSGDVGAAARALADDAERLGMRGVAADARRPAGRPFRLEFSWNDQPSAHQASAKPRRRQFCHPN